MMKKNSLIYAKAEREGCLVMVMVIEIAVTFAGLPPHPTLSPRRVERGFRKWIIRMECTLLSPGRGED